MIEHQFKKKFGQNFITDKNLLNAIANDAQIENCQVLEIGAGAGTLTQVLNDRAEFVHSYEIDLDLKEHLLSLKLNKTKFFFEDIMKLSLEKIEGDFSHYKLVANLPYYITSPLIFKFIKSNKLDSMTIMVQKEVAQRICAKENSKDYGLLSIMTAFYGESKITRIVGKDNFYPKPKVDSAVVNIKIDRKYKDVDEDKFYDLVQNLFSMRRKTIRNNLAKNYKSLIAKLDEDLLSKRSEQLSLAQIINIYKKM